MQIQVKIVSTDYELGFDLIESPRFPGRRPIIVPGDATIISQGLMALEESPEEVEEVSLGIEIDESTSIDEFASWLYGKLKDRAQKIRLLSISGQEIKVDEAEIKSAIETGVKAV